MRRQAGGSGSGSGGGICRRERGSWGGAIRCGREHTQGCKTRARERTNLEGSLSLSLFHFAFLLLLQDDDANDPHSLPWAESGCCVWRRDYPSSYRASDWPREKSDLRDSREKEQGSFLPPPSTSSPPQLEFVSKTKAAPSPSSTTCPARKRLWISSHAAEVRERGGGFFSLFQKLGPIFVMFSSSSSSSSLFFVRWWWAKMTRERRRRRGFFPRTKQSWLARLLLRGTNAGEGKRASRGGGGNSGRLFGRKSGK